MRPRYLLAISSFMLVPLFTGCRAQPKPASPGTASRSPEPNAPPPQPTVKPGVYLAPLANPVGVGLASNDLAGLAGRLSPTVVNITTRQRVGMRRSRFHRGRFHGRRRVAISQGSGFIVDPVGYVVTNAHVIRHATQIKVRLADDREFDAQVVGKDSKMDLAVIKLKGATNLRAVAFGDSDKLKVGDSVMAIGNPFGLGHTVTVGITSAKDRTIGAGPYDQFIQTDASINPGNSGGALFNLKGELVGIPTAIRNGATGIGFAVPVNALKDVLDQLKEHGRVTRGKLGVRIQRIGKDLAAALGLSKTEGALVSAIEPNSAGAKAGLKPGDVILKVGSKTVRHSSDLPRLIARNRPGSSVALTVVRKGQTMRKTAVLDRLSPPEEDDTPRNTTKPNSGKHQGRLGIQIRDNAEGDGVEISGIMVNSPAIGKFVPGDVIVEADGQRVRNASELIRVVKGAPKGKVLLFKVRRRDMVRFVAMRVD